MGTVLNVRRSQRGNLEEVNLLNPVPVEIADPDGNGLPAVAGRSTFAKVVIPGIGTGAAYADGDCFGTLIEFPGLFRPNRLSGLIHTALYYDLDDEGLQIDLHLFDRAVASPGADNAAFALADTEILAYQGTLSFTSFYNFGNNQVSVIGNAGLVVQSTGTSLWGLAVARGALNIAAANLPVIRLGCLPD